MDSETKTNKVIKKLKTKQGITVREMVEKPYYLNAPHGIIRNIIKLGYNVKSEWVEKRGLVKIKDKIEVKIINRFKRFYIDEVA